MCATVSRLSGPAPAGLSPDNGVFGAALVADGYVESAEVPGFGVGDVADDAWRPDGGKDSAADGAG